MTPREQAAILRELRKTFISSPPFSPLRALQPFTTLRADDATLAALEAGAQALDAGGWRAQHIDRMLRAKERDLLHSNDAGFNMGLATARDIVRAAFAETTEPDKAPPVDPPDGRKDHL